MRDIPDPSPAPELPHEKRSRLDRSNEVRHNVALVGGGLFALGATVALIVAWWWVAVTLAVFGLVLVALALLWRVR